MANGPKLYKVLLGAVLNTKNATGTTRYADMTYLLYATSAYGGAANIENTLAAVSAFQVDAGLPSTGLDYRMSQVSNTSSP